MVLVGVKWKTIGVLVDVVSCYAMVFLNDIVGIPHCRSFDGGCVVWPVMPGPSLIRNSSCALMT